MTLSSVPSSEAASSGARFAGLGGFVDRAGGMLVAPRATLERVLAGEGGFDEVTWLLVMRVVAGETDRIARALLSIPAYGGFGAVQGLAQAFAAVLPDFAAIVAGALVLGLVVRILLRRGGAAPSRGRELDLVAAAWVPALAVEVIVLFARHALGLRIDGHTRVAAVVVAVAWAGVCWVIALRVALRAATAVRTLGPAPEELH